MHRYVNEAVGRFHDRDNDTKYQIENTVFGISGKRVRYNDLVA